MAVETRPETAPRPERPAPPRRDRRPRPTGGGEFWWWMFMRVSGIVLLFLAVGHVLIMHVLGDGVDRVNFAFVALRWQSPFWRTWDWLLLTLALIHGINGLRVITLDYVRRPGLRVALNMAYLIIGFALIALGTIVVFSFNPCQWPGFDAAKYGCAA